VRAGHEVLLEVDNTILLIVGNLQGILGLQLRPHPTHLLHIDKLSNCLKTKALPSEGRNGIVFFSVEITTV
jgi:hypothetical protein